MSEILFLFVTSHPLNCKGKIIILNKLSGTLFDACRFHETNDNCFAWLLFYLILMASKLTFGFSLLLFLLLQRLNNVFNRLD